MRKHPEVISIRIPAELKTALDNLKKKSLNVGDFCRKAIEEAVKKIKKAS